MKMAMEKKAPHDLQAAMNMSASAANWYALYTCPRHEKRVAEQIQQRRISCFLPLYRSVRRWKDRRKELELALFPGYVFVCMGWEKRLQVLELPGVVRVVSFNGQPATLRAEEIEELRQRLSVARGVEPHPYLRKGRRVRVRSGPMQGLEGIVVRRKDRCRVVFSLDLIMRSVAVEIDEMDLEEA
jgi:transcription antitermination factor NusG